MGNISPKNQNCQFKLKFGTSTNSNKQDSTVMFTFFVLTENTHFGQIWFIKLELSVQAEPCTYLLLRQKFCSAREASLHPAFMDKCSTISPTSR